LVYNYSVETITVLGVPINKLTFSAAIDEITSMIAEEVPHQVVTVNAEFLVLAQEDDDFKKVLKSADLALADGMGPQIGAFLQGKRFPCRVPGSALTYRLAPLAAKNNWRMFFLGALPGVAEEAARKLREKYPGIQIKASGADPTPEDTEKSIRQIRNFDPHILLVAYGAPRQDFWIGENKDKLGVPVMLGVGGTLDFIAGKSDFPPRWIRNLGFEWLYRLIKEPWRWRRQLRLPYFICLLFLDMFKKG
jgi:N-acetylglucosaminyldiphosphoundecaprenol N-acetyl-beta-D-mannosaminyltransferase